MQAKFIQCVSFEKSIRNNPITNLNEGPSKQVDKSNKSPFIVYVKNNGRLLMTDCEERVCIT